MNLYTLNFKRSIKITTVLFSLLFYNINAQVSLNTLDSDGNTISTQNKGKHLTTNGKVNAVTTTSYTNIRALTELNDPLNADAYPWISGDGLRLYYTKGSSGGNNLMYTYRTTVTGNFITPVVVPISVANLTSCWLTDDELDIYICTSSDLYRAHRSSTSAAFGTPVLQNFMAAPAYTSLKGASLDNTGNNLFIQMYDGTSNTIAQLSYFTTDQFYYISSLTFPAGYEPSIGQISKDNLTYFVGAKYNNADAMLFQYDRTGTSVPFDVNSFQQVQGINDLTKTNTQPSMSNNMEWVAFVRNDTNLWVANQLYLAQRSCVPPSQPTSISGNYYAPLGSLQTYSVAAVAGATSYNWTLPSGWTGNSTTNIMSATVGANSGVISVIAHNACGSSPSSSLSVVVTNCAPPNQPGTIFGSTTPSSGSTQTYSVSPVANATSYSWTLPSGWTGNTPTSSITVTISLTGGIISVNAQSPCGVSPSSTLAVCITPNQPGIINGSTTPLAGSAQVYSVSPIANATSYNWTLPSGWTGNSTTNSINATTGTTGGIISVMAQNSCGVSPITSLNVAINNQSGGGTSCTAQLVKDIVVGSSGSSIALIKNVNNQLYFAADDWTTGNELWTSDGTEPNTHLVKDINTNGDALSVTFPTKFAAINNTVFFIAITDNEGAELWKSDGTAAGTMMVKDINPGTSSGIIVTHAELIHFNGYVYFQADDGINGEELWRTDGSAAGTVMVKNIAAGWIDAYIKNFTVSGNNLFFSANDSSIGEELWKSDGTSAGTVLVKNIASSGGSFPQFLADVNGTLFFSAYTTAEGKELWKSDGTTAGTVLVKDINPGSNPSIQYTNVNNFVSNGNVLYFTATDGVNGIELWKSDGTNGGTVLIKDIRPGSNGGLDVSNYKNFKVFNNTLYFMGNDGVNGSELWKSDGTNSGTVLVKDIRPGSSSSDPKEFIVYNSNLLFVASSNGVERLWISDGTTTGTAIVDSQGPTTPRNLTEMGGNVYFSAYTSAFGNELYVCTPSVIGIKEESTLPDLLIYPNPGTGVFSIRSENQFSYSSIKIYNTHGQVVYTSNKQVEEIDLTSQPKGIYFIEIISDKRVINKKVILQ